MMQLKFSSRASGCSTPSVIFSAKTILAIIKDFNIDSLFCCCRATSPGGAGKSPEGLLALALFRMELGDGYPWVLVLLGCILGPAQELADGRAGPRCMALGALYVEGCASAAVAMRGCM